jgi:glycosyltransferase involved in cell wall biosynthesis
MSEQANMGRVVVTVPDLTAHGGVANYYATLQPHLSPRVRLLSIGRRRGDPLWRRALRAPGDAVRLVAAVARADVLQVNPSLDRTSLMRDAFSLLLARLFRTPAMIFFRGWNRATEQAIDRRWRRLFRALYLRGPLVVVLAEEFAGRLRAWGYRGRIGVETTAVADDYLELARDRERQPRTSGAVSLLFMARLVPGKGAWQTVEAFRGLRERGVDLRLMVAGEGPELERCRAALRPDDDQALTFTGYVSGEAKRRALAEADIFVMPTTYGEGMPNAVLEAMAAGLPVITSAAGGLRDFFEDGEMGVLVDGADVARITAAMETLAADAALRQRMGRRNAAYAAERFAASRVAQRLEAMHEAVMDARCTADRRRSL